MIFFLRKIFLMFVISIVLCGFFATVYSQRLPIKNYTTDIGLPHLMNSRVFQDTKGFIWFCSSYGLTRYDGEEYLTYGKADGFPGNTFVQLDEDSLGRLWALLTNGLAIFQIAPDGQILRLDKLDHRNGLPNENFISFLREDNDRLWLGTENNGLYCMELDSLNPTQARIKFRISTEKGLPGYYVRDIFKDNRKQYWIATDRGLAVIRLLDIDRGIYRLHPITTREGLPSNQVYKIRQDRSDVMWVATEKGLARMIDVVESSGRNKFRNYTKTDGLPDHRILDLSLDRIGHLWMATPRGLARFVMDERRSPWITYYDRQQGFSENHFTSIFVDRQNILWVTTLSGAVCKLVSERFQTLTTAEGLPDAEIGPLMETRQGTLLAGSAGAVIQIRPQNGIKGSFRVHVQTLPVPLSAGMVQDFSSGTDGALLTVTERALFVIRGETIAPVPLPQELKNRTLRRIWLDPHGQLWIGTTSGLFRLKKNQITVFTRKNGLANESIRALYSDSYGHFWIGTQDGLYRILSADIRNDQPELRLFDHPELNGKLISHIFEDRLRDLWIGTDQGLIRLCRNNTDQIQKVISVDMTAAGFNHPAIISIAQDARGMLWIMTRRGVHIFNPDNLTVRRIWLKKDGLAGQEGLSPKSLLRAEDGSLWMGFSGGLTRYLPRVDFELDVSPRLIVKKIFANNERQPMSKDLQLPYTTKQISVEYTALDFIAEDFLQYQVMLEGHDAGWSDPTPQHKVRFSNLSGGNYRLKIRIADPSLPPSQTASLSIPVSIGIHPLRQWWFYVLSLTLMVSVAYFLYQHRMTQIRRRQQELEMTIHLRTQELRNQNEQIRKQQATLEQQKKQLELTIKQLTRTQNDLIHTKKMASLVQIVAGIAHELNNPLSNVSGNMQLLHDYLSDLHRLLNAYEHQMRLPDCTPESLTARIDEIKKEIDYHFLISDLDQLTTSIQNGVNRLIRIVENLRRFSRLDEAECKEFDVNESIRNVIDLFFNQYRFSLKIETHLNPLPLLTGYPQELNQALMQILLNAAQAILALQEDNSDDRENPNRGCITIDTQLIYLEKLSAFSGYMDEAASELPRLPAIQIRIRDDGIGIKDEHKDKIFDPFFTTRKIGEGTGLGLSVAYSIIEKHNGKIFFNSRFGEGTEFIIELPLESPDHETRNPKN